MATPNDIVQIDITRETVFPTAPGFGTPLLVAYVVPWLDLARRVTAESEWIDAGGTSNDPGYKMLAATFGQNPRPPAAVIGRRTRVFTQVVVLRPLNTTEGFVYDFDVIDSDGETHTINYTVLAAATTTTVGTALAALIDALAEVVSASVTGVITNTTTAGLLVNYTRLPPVAVMTVETTSADPGLDDDLTDIKAAQALSTSLSSFGIAVDHESPAATTALAAWVETRNDVYLATTSNSELADVGVTDDIASSLKDLNYTKTHLFAAQYSTQDYRSAAFMGRMWTKEPGAATFAFKTLTGIHSDVWTDAQASAIEAKNATTYRPIAGLNKTYRGKAPSGEWFDVMVGVIALGARMQHALLTLIITAEDKVPYTDHGITMLAENGVRPVLEQGVAIGFLTDDPAPIITIPKAVDVPAQDKADRILRGLKWSAKLAGAIHGARVAGTVSV